MSNLEITRKELKDLLTSKTTVLSILFQAGMFLFFFTALTGITSVMGGQGNIEVAVIDKNYADELAKTIESEKVGIKMVSPDKETFRNAIVLEPTYYGERKFIKIWVEDKDLSTDLRLQNLKPRLTLYSQKLKKQRGENSTLPVYNLRKWSRTDISSTRISKIKWEFLHLSLIPLFLFISLLVAGNLVLDSITKEISEETMSILLTTGEGVKDIISQKIIAALILTAVQTAGWLLLLKILNFEIHHTIIVFIFILIFSIAYLSISGAIGLLMGNRKEANILYTMLTGLLLVSVGFDLNPVTIVVDLLLVENLSAGRVIEAVSSGFIYLGISLTVLSSALKRSDFGTRNSRR